MTIKTGGLGGRPAGELLDEQQQCGVVDRAVALRAKCARELGDHGTQRHGHPDFPRGRGDDAEVEERKVGEQRGQVVPASGGHEAWETPAQMPSIVLSSSRDFTTVRL